MDGVISKNGINYIDNARYGNTSTLRYLLFLGSFFALMLSSLLGSGDDINRQVQEQIAQSGELLVFFGQLLTFVFFVICLCLWVKYVHRLPLKRLITTRSSIDFRRFFFAFFLWFGLILLFTAVEYIVNPEAFHWNFKAGDFFVLLGISTLMIPFQAGFEELLFRGYLMQFIGIKTRRPFIALVLTAFIFGMMHIVNPEVGHFGYAMMIYYIVSGLFFAIVTLMDDGLELSLGLHISNNWAVSILLSSQWSVLQTPSLLKQVEETPLWATLIFVMVAYPVLLYIFARKYSWKGFKSKIFSVLDK